MKNSVLVRSLVAVGLLVAVSLPMTLSSPSDQVSGGLEVLLCNPLIRHLGMTSTWEAAKAVGVKGIEIHVDPDLSCPRLFQGGTTPYSLDSRESAWRIRADAVEYELETPVLVAPIKLDPDQIKSSGAPPWAITLIRTAPYVGAKLIYFPLVTDDFTKPTISDEAFLEASVFLLNDLVSEGTRVGVAIAIENLSVYWNRGEITKQVFAEFGEEELGLCLDPINFYWYGHPLTTVYDLTRDFLPNAMHFHVKNVSHPADHREVQRMPGWNYSKNSVPAPDGDVDFEQVLRLLIDSGYNGYISIEDDSLEKVDQSSRLEVLKKDVEYVRRIVRGYRGGI